MKKRNTHKCNRDYDEQIYAKKFEYLNVMKNLILKLKCYLSSFNQEIEHLNNLLLLKKVNR